MTVDPFDELRLKFLNWSIADAQREVSQGFPFLSRIESKTVAAYLFYCSKLPAEERVIFATGMAKRLQRKISQTAAVSTSHEKTIVDDYSDWYLELNATPSSAIYSYLPTNFLAKFRSSTTEVNKKQLRKCLIRYLGSPEWDSAESWRYSVLVNGIKVHTYIDIGGRLPLRYSHSFVPETASQSVPPLNTSISSWMGLGGIETVWDLLSENGIEPAAILIKELTDHFIRALMETQSAP
jgi:hypothetical protein